MRLRQWSAGVPAGPSRSRSRTSDHYTCLALDAVSTHLVQVAQTAHSAGQRGPGVPGRILQTADVIALELRLSECEHWRHRLVRLSQRYGCRAQGWPTACRVRLACRPIACRSPTRHSSGDVLGGIAPRVAASTAVSCQVMAMGPALAGSSDTKSTACTTRTPGDHLNEARFDDVRGRRGLTPDGSRRAPIRWHVATVRHARAESPTA
jgi:hypothetical protein